MKDREYIVKQIDKHLTKLESKYTTLFVDKLQLESKIVALIDLLEIIPIDIYNRLKIKMFWLDLFDEEFGDE